MTPLKSERLIYRKIEKTDFPLFCSLYSDPLVMQYTYLDVCDESKAKEIFLEVIEAKVFTYFVAHENGSKNPIGFIFYDTVLDHTAGGIKSIGYLLHPDFWGQGYATEMGRAMIEYLFENLPIHKVDANAHIENIASEKVLQKLGMQKEGIIRQARYKHGKWNDEIHYGILREEWEQGKSKVM